MSDLDGALGALIEEADQQLIDLIDAASPILHLFLVTLH
jgi:hypothetical protein